MGWLGETALHASCLLRRTRLERQMSRVDAREWMAVCRNYLKLASIFECSIVDERRAREGPRPEDVVLIAASNARLQAWGYRICAWSRRLLRPR
jgi:hypothetical protein